MLKKSKLSLFCLALGAAALFLGSVKASAQELRTLSGYGNGYDDGYDDGYEDGYDDAMDDCPCPPLLALFSGFYAGIEGGYENYSSTFRGMEAGFFDYRYQQSAPGWVGNIFGGYGHTFANRFHLAGEVFVGTSGASGQNTAIFFNDQVVSKFSAGTSYGFNIKPGYQLPSSLVYLNLGYARTQFTDKQMISGFIANASASQSQWVNAFSYGLGAEVSIYKRITGLVEYKHLNYASYTDSNSGAKITPTDNQGFLGFGYHFAF